MSFAPHSIPPVGKKSTELLHHPLRQRMPISSFKEVLNQTIRQDIECLTNDVETLSKSQITAIINDIRAHMDAQWIRTLSLDGNAEREITPLLSLMNRFALPETETSNNRRTAQNDDDFSAPPDPHDNFNGQPYLDAIISDAARTHGVDEALVKSVIKVESNFNPNCTSPKGAMGLMQLMPQTARELGVQNGYDPVENVRAGTRYLKVLLNRYDGNIPLALAAYNWGMGNIEKRTGQIPAETSRYVDQVTNHYATLKG